MPTDILRCDFQLPPRVYIVGSGSTAAETAHLIPKGEFVIACNRAIELPIEATIWLAHDPNIAKQSWFNERLSTLMSDGHPVKLRNIRIGSPTVPVFSFKLRETYPVVKVCFKSEGDLYRPLTKALGCLSPRASVCGQAVQLAFMLGASEIVLVGVDMQGDHFSGELRYKGDWPCKPEFDWLVKWVRSQGVTVERIEDISTRKGMEPVVSLAPKSDRPCIDSQEQPDATGSLLPDIGYLCMSYDPIDRMNAVFDFAQQDWPNDRKTLYLLHQRDSLGQFPGPTFNNCGLQIVDINCEGAPWPEMWTFKFMEYLRACQTRYTLWFDEDDRYPADYTRKAIQPILDGLGRMSWSWDMDLFEYVIPNARFEYRRDWYRSPVATMVIETELLRSYGDWLWARLYEGTLRSPKRIQGVPFGGAQDDQLRQKLQHDIPDIPHHRAWKLYSVTDLANSAQLRPKGNAINYRGRRGTADECEAQPTRFDTPRSAREVFQEVKA